MSLVEDELRFEKEFLSDYELHPKLCPHGNMLRQLVTRQISLKGIESVLEIGSGTGLLTELLLCIPNCFVEAIDNDLNFLEICKSRLAKSTSRSQLKLVHADCLSELKSRAAASLDCIAQVYAMHNFSKDYRQACFKEIARVLKPGALLVLGDRIGYHELKTHEQARDAETRRYFEILIPIQKFDLLRTWILHVYGDEHASRQFIDQELFELLNKNGFEQITEHYREELNLVVSAVRS